MSGRARAYNDSAPGIKSSILTQNTIVPALKYTTKNGLEKIVKFDGIQNNILIDRKLAIVTTEKVQQQALRQSLALKQNSIQGIWEVPNTTQALRGQKMLDSLGIKNIKVRIVNEAAIK